ncbi:hypothetical protein Tco_1174923 [Tanacetum coccineum]
MYVRYQDAQDDRAVLRARIASLLREPTKHLGSTQLVEKATKEKLYKRKAAAIEKLITQRVTEALAGQDANRNNEDLQNSDSISAGRGERTTHYCTYRDFFNY